VTFNENTPSVKGAGPVWLFELDSFTNCFYKVCENVSETGSQKIEELDYMGSLLKPKKLSSKTVVQEFAIENVESMVHSHNIGETSGATTISELVADNSNVEFSDVNEDSEDCD
jgi:hypothetical protein